MPTMINSARPLPLRHLSIRVPWNDTDWTGRVCCKPGDNVSCLILPRIRETRDDAKKIALAGRAWKYLDESQLPACVSERGAQVRRIRRMGSRAPVPVGHRDMRLLC